MVVLLLHLVVTQVEQQVLQVVQQELQLVALLVLQLQVQELRAEFTDLDKLLEIVPDGEYGIVLDQNNEARADRWRRTVNTREEFDKAMAGLEYLMVPERFPEGMEFEKAEIFLLGREGAEYHLAEERTEGQYTLRCYTVDEADTFIYGYRLVYSDPANGKAPENTCKHCQCYAPEQLQQKHLRSNTKPFFLLMKCRNILK